MDSVFLIPPPLKLNKIGHLPWIIMVSEFLIPPPLKTEQNRLFTPDYKLKGLRISDHPHLKALCQQGDMRSRVCGLREPL